MSEQPVVDSAQSDGLEGLSRAASELARRRWARVEESREATNQNQEPVNPTTRTAPETEEPAEEASESGLEEGQEEGNEGEEEFEEGEELLEESEEDQPTTSLDLDSLDDDFEIVVDGKPTTARELKESRLRLEDYTRKTQALAQHREVLQKREQLALYHLGKATETVQARMQQFQNINWSELANVNPLEYQRQSALAEATKREAFQLEQETQKFLANVQQAEDAISRQQAQVAQRELKQKIPGWNNAKYYSLVDYAEKIGFDRKQVLKYTDPSVFVILDKARAFDQAQTITTQKKVKSATKKTLRATAPLPPGAKAQTASRQQVDAALQNARQEGTIDAAIAAMQAKRRANR
jgi:hypothetical protein